MSKNGTAPTGRNEIALGRDFPNTLTSERAKVLGRLPKDWRWTNLGELKALSLYGPRFSSDDYRDHGTFVLRTTDISESGKVATSRAPKLQLTHDDLKRYQLKRGDLLITRTGSLGTLAVFNDDVEAIAGAYLIQYRLAAPLITSWYVFYALKSPAGQRHLIGRGAGVGRPNLNAPTIEAFSFPLPPEPNQRRIVAEIEKQFTRLDAGVAALRRVQANLKRYRAAILKAACEGKLVATEPEWPKHQISAVIEAMDQGWSPKCESEPSPDDEIWAVIKTTAIQNLRFDEVENKKLPAALKPRPHLELQPGDLLITRAGPRSRVGVACLVRRTRPRLMLCDKAYRLRCKAKVANPAFLEIILNAPDIVDRVNELKTGISDSGVNLTQKRFGELSIPLPPLAEQRRIVAEVERRLSVADELEAVVSANLQRATRLRQSILQKAFTGDLSS